MSGTHISQRRYKNVIAQDWKSKLQRKVFCMLRIQKKTNKQHAHDDILFPKLRMRQWFSCSCSTSDMI